MKSFRTDFPLNPEPFLDHATPILTLGSCFAEHVGQRLISAKWRGLNAPLGTLFHPLVIGKLLRLSLEHRPLDAELFVEHDGAFYHHDLHGRFYGTSPAALQEQWRSLAAELRALIAQNPCVLLTLGTAWVYSKDGVIVANCHKQPAQHFHKRLLTSEEIQASLAELRHLLPASSFILSLSPVRHTRDTMVLNSLSKSLLLVSIHAFLSAQPERSRYFPAYELLLDDLRDYRYYEADMIHPSSAAIDYIWERFAATYLTPEAQGFLRRWQGLQQFLQHRPHRPEAPSYQKHLLQILAELRSFDAIDCAKEIHFCQSLIHPQ